MDNFSFILPKCICRESNIDSFHSGVFVKYQKTWMYGEISKNIWRRRPQGLTVIILGQLFLFPFKTYVVGTCQYHFATVMLLGARNGCFYKTLNKIITESVPLPCHLHSNYPEIILIIHRVTDNIKGNGYSCKGGNPVKIYHISWDLLLKEFSSQEGRLPCYRCHFKIGFVNRKANRNSVKLSPFVKMSESLPSALKSY